MINTPMDVLAMFPIRKSKKQKAAFRDALIPYVEALGYTCKVERGAFGVHNVVLGDPDKARFLITAHYDTCAHSPFPNFSTPCNFLLFLLYQIFLVFMISIVVFLVAIAACLIFQSAAAGSVALDIAFLAIFILILYGPANKQNANDNTSGVVAVLDIAQSLPEDFRDQVCFVLFDLEEGGLIGSTVYRFSHGDAVKKQVVLNLDCVGDGDDFVLFPKKKVRKDAQLLARLRESIVNDAPPHKRISIREKGFSFFPSDQALFPYGIGIASFKRCKLGFLYLPRIHTSRDTVLKEENIVFLKNRVIKMVSFCS